MNGGSFRTVTVIAATTAVVSSLLLLTGVNDVATAGAGLIPARLTGAVPPDFSFGPMQVPAWLTPFTSLLIHGDFLHLGFNMLMFVYLGRLVEQVLGGRLIAVLYALSGIGAAALGVVTDPAGMGPTIGASGAVSGVMATYALLYSQQEVRSVGPLSANLVRALWFGAAWIGIQLLVGYASSTGAANGEPGVAIMAHIGGFLVGLVLTRPMLRHRFGRFRGVEGDGPGRR